MNDTIITELVDLPPRVKGLTHPNPDGTYTVFLNARLSIETQRQTYRHELRHIRQGDFSGGDVQLIEAYAHEIEAL